MKKLCLIALLILFLCPVYQAQKILTELTYSVHLPAKKAAKTPVLVLLHGYGSNESDLFELAKTMDPRFITFSLRAPNPSKEEGFCWYELGIKADNQFTYDYREAEASRKKILAFISHACKAFGADSTQVFILGFSQGAMMAYDIALTNPTKVKGILALSGRIVKESAEQKTDLQQLSRVKFFIAHGRSDNVIKLEEAEKAEAFLKEKKVTDVTLKLYEMPHALSGQELNDFKAWLAKLLSPAKKPEVKK